MGILAWHCATVMDETVCVFPLAGTSLIITFECLNPQAPYQELVLKCCASIYVAVAVCTLICIESAGPGCIACIVFGVYGVEDALTDCYRGLSSNGCLCESVVSDCSVYPTMVKNLKFLT